MREKRRRKEGVNGHFRRAAHEGREQYRHTSVAFRGERTSRHDRRDRAAETDQKRHDAAAGKPDFPEQFVHHESDACHVAAVFQQRQKEKEHGDDGDET